MPKLGSQTDLLYISLGVFCFSVLNMFFSCCFVGVGGVAKDFSLDPLIPRGRASERAIPSAPGVQGVSLYV